MIEGLLMLPSRVKPFTKTFVVLQDGKVMPILPSTFHELALIGYDVDYRADNEEEIYWLINWMEDFPRDDPGF